MTGPLVSGAIPGFRAWLAEPDGRLLPATAMGQAWRPGVNEAACRLHAHQAPVSDCTCGLYAFHTVHRQLASEPVIGAVAAWGAIDAYARGFRAQRSMIVALARPSRARHGTLAAVERAAERYGVPLVDRSELYWRTALHYTAPSAELVGVADAQRAVWAAQRRGYEPDPGVWVQPQDGLVTVGMTAELRRWLGESVEVEAPAAGEHVTARATIVARGRHEVKLSVPVAGTVVASPAAVAAPQDGAGDSDGAAWWLRVRPSDWAADARELQWGLPGRAACVTEDAAFEHLLEDDDAETGWVRSWADARAYLESLRDGPPAPRYASEAVLYDDLGLRLGRRLESEPAARERLTRLDTIISLRVHEPAATLAFDLRRGQGRLLFGARAPVGEMEVSLPADALVALLEGRLDLAREARCGRIVTTRGGFAACLSALAVLQHWAGMSGALTGRLG